MNSLNILPKIYEEIPGYQEFLDRLKEDLPKIEGKLPIISEEIALLLRYETEIDPQVCSIVFFSPERFSLSLYLEIDFRRSSILISSLGKL